MSKSGGHIEISLSEISTGRIEVNGKDLSSHIDRVEVDCVVGEPPRVVLHIAGARLGAFMKDPNITFREPPA